MSDGELALAVEARKKSSLLAVFLNVVFPGVGYMYCGRWFLGIIALALIGSLLVMSFALNILALGLGLPLTGLLYIVLTVDGVLCARQYNRNLIAEAIAANSGSSPQRSGGSFTLLGTAVLLGLVVSVAAGIWAYSSSHDQKISTELVQSNESPSAESQTSAASGETEASEPLPPPNQQSAGGEAPPVVREAEPELSTTEKLGPPEPGPAAPAPAPEATLERKSIRARNDGALISAVELVRLYDENHAAADARFKGREVVVYGSIEKWDGDSVSLKDREKSEHSVRCDFGQNLDLSHLKKGEMSALAGTVKGRRFTGRVDLDGCRLIRLTSLK